MKKHILIIILILILSGCQEHSNETMDDPIKDGLIIENEITSNIITLPETFENIKISWSSSHPNLISQGGRVSRVYEDQHVTLQATYIFNNQTFQKTFEVIIKGNPLSDIEKLTMDMNDLELPPEVSDDLLLPIEGLNGSRILWSSSKPYVLNSKGKYYQPLEDETLTLTAILILGNTQLTKDFELTIIGLSDQDKVLKDAAMLHLETQDLDDDIHLPKRGYFTSDISWKSSHPFIINDDGQYIKPIGNHTVILTATITKGASTMEKTFDISVSGYSKEAFFAQVSEKLTINHGIKVIFDDIILPTSILNIGSISWESSHPDILSHEGRFNMPEQTTHITLTATVTASTFEKTYDFTYLIYGLNEETSTHSNQIKPFIQIDANAPLHIEDNEHLTFGLYDQVIYKNGQLILSKNHLQGSYTSPILVSDLPIEKVFLMWGSITHKDAKTELLTRYETKDGWSRWESHGTWGYGGDNQPPVITKSLPNITHFQYKVILTRTSQSISSPVFNYASFQFISSTPKSYDISLLRREVLYDVPQLKQAQTLDPFLWNNICWATSISMLLNYYGHLSHSEIPHEYYSVLIRQGTERFGTTKNDIGATQFGVYMHELEFSSYEMLLTVIDHYGPLLVGVSKGQSPDGKFGPISFSSGHVVVVVGYEINEDGSIDIIINDPAVQSMTHPIKGSLEEFMLVWDKGGALMQPMDSSK